MPVGRLMLALEDARRQQTAFDRPALARQSIAESIEKHAAASGVIALYNRRMPGGRGEIDVIAIARSGVFVIAVKDWEGLIRIADLGVEGRRLLFKGQDRTDVIADLEQRLSAIRFALGGREHAGVPVHGRICVPRTSLPLLRAESFREHRLVYRKALAGELNADGPLDIEAINAIARRLDCAFPPA